MNSSDTLILNVDDNDGARYVKTRILQGAGFRVVEAANGTDALALARKLVPALVLLDVKLPDINGIEVCRQIKADPATSVLLVLQTSAALTGRDDKIRGLEGGADNYLAAPIEADELVANVNALLRLQRTQTDLRNSEERFRQLTDNIEDVFWMFSLDGSELLYVSKAYQAMWGRLPSTLQQDPNEWLGAVHADDRASVQSHWQAVQQGKHYEQEYRLCQPGGKVCWVRDRAFVVSDAKGVPYRIARITSDVTRRKEMESLLVAADDNKNDFLATLAHELRNPLSPIRNAVALMSEADISETEVHQRARRIIMRQVNHLSRLVDDLLDVARISAGKLTLRRQDVELHNFLELAMETAKPLLDSREHSLAVKLPEQPVWLSGDPARLAQAVGNLLHNAAKFTNRGGKIRLEAVLALGGIVRIAVHDNGIGITDYNLPRVFHMFAQGASTHDRAHDGLGIGLSLVATLTRLHDGRVWAESPGIDQGSSFIIELPVLERKPSTIAQQSTPKVAEPVPSRKLLLVDDNEDSIDVMAELLRLMGHEVYAANNAEDALKLAHDHDPDAIILDIGLPNIDGHALARMLRADPAFAETRLICHTGFGSELDRQKTTESGFDFHLVKPASVEDLQDILRDI